MARPKVKEWKNLGIRLDKNVFDMLEKYCEETGLKKTTVVEKALKAYINERQSLLKDS